MTPTMNRTALFSWSSAWGAIAAVIGLLSAGCNIIPAPSADLTRYYVLTAPTLHELGSRTAMGGLQVGLRTVELAPYLRKGTLVVRTGENEVTFPIDARWGVPLEQEIARALRAGLTTAPTVGRVFLQPFAFDAERDFDVIVQVINCEGATAPGGKAAVVKFAALIEIVKVGPGASVVARRMYVAPETAWDGKDFAHLAAQLSAAVAGLSQEVIAALPEKK